jgi:hypothetical protein
MAEMPERLWAYPREFGHEPTWYSNRLSGGTEFIRTDLVDDLVKALEPFAKAAHAFHVVVGPDGVDDGLTVTATIEAKRECEAMLCTSDFSRALAALTRIKGEVT